jgi:hypothetical protein
MRKTTTWMLLALIAVLGACQSASDADRPIVKEGECQPRQVESGTCIPDE